MKAKPIEEMSIEELRKELLKLKVKQLQATQPLLERTLPRSAAERAKMHAGPEIVWGQYRGKHSPEPVEREVCRHKEVERDRSRPITESAVARIYNVPTKCMSCGREMTRLVKLERR